MAHGKSRNHRRKAKASLTESRSLKTRNGRKNSDENYNKSRSAFERFLLPLTFFQWFCKKREPDYEVDDDQESSPMPWNQHSPTNSPSPQVPSVGIGGDRIPTRRGGLRPYLPLPYNQPTTFEGAQFSPLYGDEAVQPSRAEDREDIGANQFPLTPEDLVLFFAPLPGAVMDDDYLYPPTDLYNIPGSPIRHSSMVRHGQLPPLCYAASAPTTLSSTGLNARADNHPVHPLITPSSRPTPIRDAWQNTRQDGEISTTETVNVGNDKKEERKKKKMLTAEKKKKSSKKEDASIIDKIPTVKEWAKQQEKKRKAEEKLWKEQLKKEMKKQKEMEKKMAKENKEKEQQKQKEMKDLKKAEKEVAKVKKAAEKEEKAAANLIEKKMVKRAKFDERMQKILDASDKQMAADLEKGEHLFLEQQRNHEEKAKRMVEKNAKTEKTIKALKEKLERKEKKVVMMCEHRDSKSRGRRPTMLAVYKTSYKIDNYYKRISSIKNVIAKLNKKLEARKTEIERLVPKLVETAVSIEAEQANELSSSSSNATVSEPVDIEDDFSVLEMLCCFDSDCEDSDDEGDEFTYGEK